ncbi:MAG: 2-oxoglutarate dehydrogenase E1 component [Deltaproteobacteria bacterium]|nr:MAG: 2-oxoglutarate dehydrogenase E1 component [Deltaproteobacteria bacterium]
MDFDRDFGVNQVFVEDQYEKWRNNPAAVDEQWQQYFARLHGLPSVPPLQTSAWSQPPAPVTAPPPVAMPIEGHFGGALIDIGAHEQDRLRAEELQERVAEMINAYRIRGHLFANLDPLGLLQPPAPELEPEHFGLSEAEFDHPFAPGDFAPGESELTLREILARLKRTYCRTIGVEYMHGEDPAIKRWLQERMESTQNTPRLSREEKLRILARLTDAETLETFLHRKYIGKKRFSLEGGESLIPLLDWLIDEFTAKGGEEIVLGMAHRGRLNVLVNVLGKGLKELFAEFEDTETEVQTMMGRGDVKYHMGYSSDRQMPDGRHLHLSLAFNPSHLEAVDPVVVGRVRAKQDRELNWQGAPNRRDPERRKVLPVLIHGDAAFAGQGVVAEVLNLANLEGYTNGGTVHVIINNQVGFTTNPEDARSTPYCTDIARALRAPVFHVNGEDPEAVIWAVQLAVDYRQTFQQDVLIDLYCYRKYGHNEGDEPAFTQPKMYEVIRRKKPPREVYARRLAEEGVATDGEADELMQKRMARLEEELEHTRKEGAHRSFSAMAGLWSKYRGGFDAQNPEVPTNVPDAKLRQLLVSLSRLPADFTPNDKIAKLLEGRRKIAEAHILEPFDWGVGEHLAFATLLDEGIPVRFSGQDSRRGTFSHRHAVLSDVKDGKRYTPLAHLREGQGRFDIFDSPLSELGVMGFDYGWSLDMPEALCVWEAQFGDFANGAQVVIDQFISSAEDKWNRLSGITLLLPHGFEGQGPEHSSARLERFLQLCAEDNMQVCFPTTPAQMFHLLRRQVLRTWRKPLVVMTPKSLLRHKAAVSTLDDLSKGAFRRILWDNSVKNAKRVLLCTGKVYYDLVAGREAKKRNDVAIVRIEQLYPLADEQLAEALQRHKGAELVWVQEEPFNMGAWYHVNARWPAALGALRCISRAESASPATGSEKSHKYEQQLLVDQAFA